MLGWEFPPHITGGLGVACYGLHRALSEKIAVELILPKAHDISPYYEGELYGEHLAQRVTEFSQNATEQAAQLDFDIIHAHDWMTFQAAVAIKHISKKPLILHIHSSHYDRCGGATHGWIYNIEKYAMRDADHVISVSSYTQEILKEHYGVSESKITVIHNGVEPVTAFRSSQQTDHKTIVFLGRLTAQKGPRAFVEIAKRVIEHEQNTIFIMAGCGDLEDQLKRDVSDAGLTDTLKFSGFLDTQNVQRLLSQAHVYCMPSLSEPFGLSALEAAQFDVPVVLSTQSGAAEVLHGALGADCLDIDGMSQHVINLIRDASLRAHCIALNQKCLKKLTWRSSAAKVLSVYRRFL